MKKIILSVFLSLFFISAGAQIFESDVVYPLSIDNNTRVMTGSMTPSVSSDNDIYSRAMLWTVENVCPKQLEGINVINHKTRTFTFGMDVESLPGSKLNNLYHCDVQLTAKDGRLVFYVSNITVQSKGFFKKISSLDSYQIEKKQAHKDIADEFVRVTSSVLNKMLEYVNTTKTYPVTHWDEIIARRPEKGMNVDECRIAFGKPQVVSEDNGGEQWMYTSTFFLFFKNDKVVSVIK